MNELLPFAVVADGLPCGIDSGAQCGIRNDALAPYDCEKRLLTYDMIAIFDQVQDQIEHLRLDAHNIPRAPQLAALDIHDAITKQQAHRRHSDGHGTAGSNWQSSGRKSKAFLKTFRAAVDLIATPFNLEDGP